jgi:hypothetical protein
MLRNRWAQDKTLVILFRLCHHLPNPVSAKIMGERGIEGAIQSIRQIDADQFSNLIQGCGIESSFLAN